MKIKLFALFVFTLILSCQKDERVTTPPATNSTNLLVADYLETQITNDFQPVGPCYGTSVSWWAGNVRAGIYEQSGQYWMDSLNYVIRQPIPITLTSASSFTFNDYYTIYSQSYHITGGSGYLLNDTLVITVNAESTNSCTNPFVFHGKYFRQ